MRIIANVNKSKRFISMEIFHKFSWYYFCEFTVPCSSCSIIETSKFKSWKVCENQGMCRKKQESEIREYFVRINKKMTKSLFGFLLFAYCEIIKKPQPIFIRLNITQCMPVVSSYGLFMDVTWPQLKDLVHQQMT